MIEVRPTVDPAEIQGVMDAPEVAAWCGLGDAWEAYLGAPNCTFLGVYADGEIVGGVAVLYINDGTAQVHNLLTDRCRRDLRIHAMRWGLAWGFGPGGLTRLVGCTEESNRAAMQFTASMAGWSRLFEEDGHVWTALNIQDWPWQHARWMRAASGEAGSDGVILGAMARLSQAGSPERGVALHNEWAALLERPTAELFKAGRGEALIRRGRALYRVHPGGLKEVSDEHWKQ